MCVWSAYIGKKQAAAEVWKTGTAIEGIWGGFYTGIAAVDASGIHCAKCCGYSKYWEEKFSLSDLPGNAGFFLGASLCRHQQTCRPHGTGQ